jgi:hypothetical protein
LYRVAAIKQARIASIAIYRGKVTISSGCIALFVSAQAFIILTDRRGEKASALRRVARDNVARVSIARASDRSIHAGTVFGDAAGTGVANVEVCTIDRKELARDSWGDQHGTQVLGTRVAVRTISRVAARLTISVAHIAPIVVRTIELEGGGQLDIGPEGVALAPEEIEPVVISGRKTESSGDVVQRERTCLWAVHTAEIKGELVVDEHEHVIITKEVEGLTSIVGESSMCLVTKMKVVVISVEGNVLVLTGRNIPT